MKFLKSLPWEKFFWIFIAYLFANFMAWSVMYETLLPLYRAGDMAGFFRNLAGVPILFLGVGAFCYAAFRFLQDTFRTLGEGKEEQSIWRAWIPSLIIFLASVVLMGIGGRLTR